MGAMVDIGATLCEARERRHLTQAEVEAATMIPARYLDALEHERYERLPEGLYRRSFLREYAEYLGLNSDLYVVQYDLESAPPTPPETAAPPSRQLQDAAASVSFRLVGLVGAVVLVVAGLWWLGGRGGAAPRSAPHESPAAASAPSTAAVATPSAPAHRAPPVLRLVAARGDCWLSVRVGSVAGALVYQATLRRGSSVVFGLRRRLLIRMGAPENLTATIAGRSITTSLPTRTADVVASVHGLAAA